MAEMTRIVIADASARSRAALRLLLEQSSDVGSISEASSCEECLATLTHAAADILLVDWRLPCNGLEQLVSVLRTAHPGLLIIALSARPEDRSGALAAGAHTFVSKVDAPDALLASLRRL